MRVLDRLVTVILGVLLIAAVTVVILMPETFITPLANLATANVAVRLLMVVVINACILGVLFWLLRRPRTDAKGLVVKASSGAFTEISVESAQEMLLNAMRGVSGVTSSNAVVKAVDGRADIELDVLVSGRNIQVPEKQNEIHRTIEQVMLKQLGVKYYQHPRVHIALQPEPEPVKPAPVTEKPTPPPAPAQPVATGEKDTLPSTLPAPSASVGGTPMQAITAADNESDEVPAAPEISGEELHRKDSESDNE